MPSLVSDGHVAKRQKVTLPDNGQRDLRAQRPKSRLYAPFRTVGLVSPTPVPFTAVPLGKTTFQITTSVGRSLQTYDLRRGLNLVFITRPQTPGPITATIAWADRVFAAWDGPVGAERGVWVFKRGKKVDELKMPNDLEDTIVQLLILGSWIVGCCKSKIEVWSSATYEHYTTLQAPFSNGHTNGKILTGGICSMPTYTNKIFAGREDGTVDIWNVSTGKLLYTIYPRSSDAGPVSVMEPTPALSLLAIAYAKGDLVIQDVQADLEMMRVHVSAPNQLPITSISFRTDGLGAGQDGQESGVMATASYNSGDVTLWDLNDGGRRIGSLRAAHREPSHRHSIAGGGISKAAFLPGQAVLVSTGLDNSLKTWIFDQTPFSPVPRSLHSRSGHAAPVSTLDFLPAEADGADAGGKWLLSTAKDKSLWGWSLRRDGQSTELSQGNTVKKAKSLGDLGSNPGFSNDSAGGLDSLKAPEITCLACNLNRDGGMGTMPGVKTMWASAKQLKGKSTATEQNLTGWESIVTGHEGDRFARTWFWGRKRAGRWLLETGDKTPVKSVAMSPCGTFALLGSEGGGIDMYNLQSGLHRQKYPAPLTPAQAKKLQLENSIKSGQKRWSKGQGRHTHEVSGLYVDNLNRTVISCDSGGKVKFWDFTTGILIDELDWQGLTAINRSAYHRPNELLALACDDGCIRLVDIETRKVVRELLGCKVVKDLCFSNEGRWVVAASSDSVIRTWDLPTGHLIDAIQLRSQCRAISFSATGEFLAVAQENSIGVQIWTNRTLFTHVPTRQLSNNEAIPIEDGPTASGEGGQAMLAEAFAEADEQDFEEPDTALPLVNQLSDDMTTLSLVPKSRWQNLINIELIRERNKPVEPPKAPQSAPFFLQSLQDQRPTGSTSGGATALEMQSEGATEEPSEISATERSRVMRMERNAGENRFASLLRQGVDPAARQALLDHLKDLPPSAADIEIRSLSPIAPYTELLYFVEALIGRLNMRQDYELVQAWMAVFLKCHGEILQEILDDESEDKAGSELIQAVRRWRDEQKKETERLGGLVGYCSGVVNFMRSGR